MDSVPLPVLFTHICWALFLDGPWLAILESAFSNLFHLLLNTMPFLG